MKISQRKGVHVPKFTYQSGQQWRNATITYQTGQHWRNAPIMYRDDAIMGNQFVLFVVYGRSRI